MLQTSGQAFHDGLCTAIEMCDLPALASFYHPDAIQVSLNTGQIFRGLGAIVAAFEETLRVSGPVKPVARDSFVEYGDVLCVEATQATRFAQVQTYDVYVLRAGAIRYQFSGMISPRQPATPLNPDAPTTAERQFHRRFCAAAQAPDFDQLRTLYRPDAVAIAASTGIVLQGRDAIMDGIQQSARTNGPPRLKALTRFIEAPDLVCTEGIMAQKFGLIGGDGPVFDVQFYEIFLLQAGAMRYQFSGMISPRPAELKPVLQKLSDRLARAWERSVDSLIYGRWRR